MHLSLRPGNLTKEKEEAKFVRLRPEPEGSIPSMGEALPLLGHD